MNQNINKHRNQVDILNSVGSDIFDSIVNKEEQAYHKFVDIYDFFDVFYNLLDSLNLLNKDSKDESKISLVEEYPDTEYEEDTFVVYSIGKRSFFTNKSHGENTNIKQHKPLQLEEEYDTIQNNIKTDYAYKFENEIEFQIFSTSTRRVQEISRLLEGIILKYRGHLLLYVDKVLYTGQTELEYNPKYFMRRLFSKSVKMQVITLETYSTVSEEIKYMNMNN